MKIVGFNINHPDSSICLLVNGKILFVVEEIILSMINYLKSKIDIQNFIIDRKINDY